MKRVDVEELAKSLIKPKDKGSAGDAEGVVVAAATWWDALLQMMFSKAAMWPMESPDS